MSRQFRHGNRSRTAQALVLAAAMALAILPVASVASAQAAPDYDVRGSIDTTLKSPPRLLPRAQQGALERLREEVGEEVSVEWSSLTAIPSRLSKTGQALTGPSAAPARQVLDGFLGRHRELLGVAEQDLEATQAVRSFVSEHNGVSHFTLQQQVDGIEVFGAVLKANVDAEGRILNLSSSLIPEASTSLNVRTPTLSEEDALFSAAGETRLDDPVATRAGELVYFPLTAGELRLGWRVVFEERTHVPVYEAIVDAVDGRMLWRKSLTDYNHFPAHGLVYTGDNPAPNTPLGSSVGIVPRQDVPFNGGDFFPHDDLHYDWWNGGARTTTTSNNVDAYIDRDGDDSADGGSRPTAGAGEDFSFAIDLTVEPDVAPNPDAMVTNLFYWVNRAHDFFYSLGFDEVAGNFQDDNLGLGGSGGDRVLAETQDNRDGDPPSLCNANMSNANGDGTQPRMQMFLCDNSTPERGNDLEGTVIVHEYTHGVHRRLVDTSGNQRANEGWSDYFGISLTSEPDDPYGGGYPRGDWYTNSVEGNRSDPYSTDPTIYQRTYADINDATTCAEKTCSSDPTETCDKASDCTNMGDTCDSQPCMFHEDCDSPPLAIDQGLCTTSEHRTGELWANALWISAFDLVEKWGFAAGRGTFDRLVVDGMKLSPDDPTLLDGRDAILLADLATNGGVNQCLIWDGFAKMGMGVSALTTGVNDINPIEAFDVPAQCSPVIQVNLDGDLGAVCMGETASGHLEVFNTGGGDLIVTAVEKVSGSDDISVDPMPETPVFIGADSHVDFTVTCDPSSAGTKTATIRISSNDSANPEYDVEVSCVGGEPEIVTVLDHDFGEVCIEAPHTQELRIQNSGTCDLEVDNVVVVDADGEFALATVMTFPTTVAPGGEITLPIELSPNAFGPADAQVQIHHDADNAPDPKLLNIVGVAPPGDIQVALANSGDFGAVCTGDHADLDVTLFNEGRCNLEIFDIEILPDAGSFELPEPPSGYLPLTLSPDADFRFPVRYAPEICSDSVEERDLKITSDDPDEMMVTLDISGTSPCPQLVIDPPDLTELFAFPATVVEDEGEPLGCYSERTTNLRNAGGCPLIINDITAVGTDNPADFLVTEPTQFPIVLPTGEETLSVTVRFSPLTDRMGGAALDPLSPDEILGQLTVHTNDQTGDGAADMGSGDLCGEGVNSSGVRILVSDTSSGDPVPIDEVDVINITSKGKGRPGPINLRFTDHPLSSTSVCGNPVDYHVDQETLPSTATTGSNPSSSYQAKAQEGNLQTSESFGLAQCEFREFELQLQDSDSPVCELKPKGDSCSTDGECCSGKCKGPAGGKTCK